MLKVLRAFKFRGCPVYIRHSDGRWYELLFYYQGQIHSHQLFVEKSKKHEKRLSLEQRDAAVIVELEGAAHEIITTFIKNSRKVVIKNFINKFKFNGKRTKEQSSGEGSAVS